MFSDTAAWRRFLAILVLSACAAASLFAGGSRETETKISLQRPSTYISPSGPESARRTLDIDNIQLQIDKNGSIKRYDFSIYDKAGKVVWSKSAVQASGKGFLGEAFNVGAKPVSLPTKFAWNGVDQDGKPLPDGEYFYQLTAIDSYGFPASTPPLAVVIDTVPPRIGDIILANSIVSPDGDGQKDRLEIKVDSGPAASWTERVLGPDGSAVWTRRTDNPGDTESTDQPLPRERSWDPALREDGSPRSERLAEGSYSWELTGTDHAGNIAVKKAIFKISFSGSAIAVGAEGGRGAANSDDGIVLLTTVADTAGASGWSLEIADQDGVVWRRYTGTGLIPDRLKFSGRGRAGQPDNDADRLKDGTYTVKITQNYDSGFAATDQSFAFTMDSTPPSATLLLDTASVPTNPALHPWFGGANRATLRIQLAVSEDLPWTYVITDMDGRLPGYEVPAALLGAPDANLRWQVQWNGTVPAGSRSVDGGGAAPRQLAADEALPNGRWALRAVARDAAGNEGASAPQAFVYQAGPMGPLALRQDAREISPGVAGAAEQVRLTVDGLAAAEVDQAVLTVLDGEGQEICRKAFRPELPFTWQGQRSDGLPAPNGSYRLKLLVQYRNGDEIGLDAEPLSLSGRGERRVVSDKPGEIIARAISLTVDTPLILDSANGPAVPVAFTALNSEGFPGSVAWKLAVTDASGTVVWRASGTGTPAAPVRWDGQKPDGSYVGGFERLGVRWEMEGAALDGPIAIDREFMTGIPVAAEDGRLRVLAPDVLFAGDNYDPFVGDGAQIAGNIDLLRRLGSRLALVRDHRIAIEGYATYAWGTTDPKVMAREQERELIPLSRQRAHEVRKSLFTLGVAWDNMSVAAMGGANPVAPWEDLGAIWKNRRVVMYLE